MGLYDDEDAAVDSGDVNHKDYFWAKACYTAMEEALKTRQPEKGVGQLVDKLLDATRAALKTYANHKDLQAWKAKGETIKGKIDPSAKHVPFAGSFPFAKNEFTQGWAALEHARFALKQDDWQTVFEESRSVSGRWYHCTGAAKNYTDEWKKYFDEGTLEAKELFSQANTRRSR